MTAIPRPVWLVRRAADCIFSRIVPILILSSCVIAIAALVLVVELALSLHAVGG